LDQNAALAIILASFARPASWGSTIRARGA
jgi:hypothetical protein